MSGLQELYARLLARRDANPDESWTARLMQGGITTIGKKISEEATELALAARELEHARARGADKDEIARMYAHATNEAADLLYHHLVLLAYLDIPPQAVESVLESRSGASGIEEKRSRGKPD